MRARKSLQKPYPCRFPRVIVCREPIAPLLAEGPGWARPSSTLRREARQAISSYHHNVYVVELSRDVLYEPKFRKANPGYDPAKPCVYVGMTGLSPDERFDKHKAGFKSNKFVLLYGVRLLPELYEMYNPMPYEGAREMEVELAIGLKEEGYGVWQD